MAIKKTDIRYDRTTNRWEVTIVNDDDSIHLLSFAEQDDAQSLADICARAITFNTYIDLSSSIKRKT